MASRTVCLLERSTRRSATVTISAPEAARASRVSSLDTYFPVPTMMRERKVRLPRVQVSIISDISSVLGVSGISATSYKGDDLEAVAGGEHGGRVLCPRHDLAVALDGDGFAGEA